MELGWRMLVSIVSSEYERSADEPLGWMLVLHTTCEQRNGQLVLYAVVFVNVCLLEAWITGPVGWMVGGEGE